jgi:hypothetical protein
MERVGCEQSEPHEDGADDGNPVKLVGEGNGPGG